MGKMNVPITEPVWFKKPKYAKCRLHGNGPGYVACIHVLEQFTPVGFLEHPGVSNDTLGTMLCDLCYESHPIDYEKLKIACAKCVSELGLNKPKAVASKPLVIQ